MKRLIIVAGFAVFVVACGTMPQSVSAPAAQPDPYSVPVQAVPTPPGDSAVTPQSTPSVASVSCESSNAAPMNAFRSDDPSQLALVGKPKLVEFFAFW